MKYEGLGGRHYDSLAEGKASYQLAKHGFLRHSKPFKTDFFDSDNRLFNARPDFYHAGYGIALEYKAGPLNGLKTKSGSESRLADIAEFRGGTPTQYDNLKFGWNHSKRKQAIVQAALTPYRFIVCFEDDSTPTFSEALSYMSAGILFCTMKGLPSYLAALRLRQLGLQVGFTHSYTLEDDSGSELPASIAYA